MLNQHYPTDDLKSYPNNIHFNIILQPTTIFLTGLLYLKLSDQDVLSIVLLCTLFVLYITTYIRTPKLGSNH
jgi:hypothetical protein